MEDFVYSQFLLVAYIQNSGFSLRKAYDEPAFDHLLFRQEKYHNLLLRKFLLFLNHFYCIIFLTYKSVQRILS